MTAHVRAWRKANPEKARAIRKRQQAQPGYKAACRRSKLLARYGLTLEEYEALLTAQSGVCGVCFRPPTARMKLAVDHDHRVEKTHGMRASIRGLVHAFPCNYVLLRKGFTAAVLRGAADYLDQQPTKTQVILGRLASIHSPTSS